MFEFSNFSLIVLRDMSIFHTVFQYFSVRIINQTRTFESVNRAFYLSCYSFNTNCVNVCRSARSFRH